MALTDKIEMSDSRDWYITVGLLPEPVLMIPITQLNDLLPPETIEHIQWHAGLCTARDLASNIESECIQGTESLRHQPVVSWLEILLPYKDYSNEVSHTCRLLQGYTEPASTRPKSPARKQFVYFIQAENGLTKIGKSVEPDKRIQSLKTASPLKLEIIRVIETADMHTLEQYYHKKFAEKRVKREWFDLSEEDLVNLTNPHH